MRIILAVVYLLAYPAVAEGLSCYTKIEPTVTCDGANAEYQTGFYLTDIDGRRLPAWVPPAPKIVAMRYGHTEPNPSGSDGQWNISIDAGRAAFNTGTGATRQLRADISHNYALANICGSPGCALEQRNTFNPPIILDRSKDSLWVSYRGCSGGHQVTIFWQMCWVDEGLPTPSGWVSSADTGYLDTLANWAGYTMAVVVPRSQLAYAGGTQARVTIGGSGLVVAKASICTSAMSGDKYDASSCTALAFGGTPGITVNGEVTSDGASFALDGTKDLIVKLYTTAGQAKTQTPPTPGNGWFGYRTFWTAGDDIATLNPGGYSETTNNIHALVRVETYH